MADLKSTASSSPRATTSVKAKKSSNIISLLAPILCVVVGYAFWRFVIGNPDNFNLPDNSGGFWPNHKDPKGDFARMYDGGIIVPILIGCLLIVTTFVIERALTISKATGKGSNAAFVRKIQFFLADKKVDAAIAECDKQKGSVGNVMKAGLRKYQEMISNTELTTDQKVMAIQKEVEEATALELPMLEKNLVFLSTLASVSTLIGLLGTVIGMIRAFGNLGESGGGEAARELSKGIAEALYNTALGIGSSAFAIITYNIFTTKIDGITHGIDESGFSLTQSFASLYK